MPSHEKIHEALAKRLEELEKCHGKFMAIKDELRTISSEYSDIRSRLESDGLLIDRLVREIEVERRMRFLNLLLALIVLVLVAIIVIKLG